MAARPFIPTLGDRDAKAVAPRDACESPVDEDLLSLEFSLLVARPSNRDLAIADDDVPEPTTLPAAVRTSHVDPLERFFRAFSASSTADTKSGALEPFGWVLGVADRESALGVDDGAAAALDLLAKPKPLIVDGVLPIDEPVALACERRVLDEPAVLTPDRTGSLLLTPPKEASGSRFTGGTGALELLPGTVGFGALLGVLRNGSIGRGGSLSLGADSRLTLPIVFRRSLVDSPALWLLAGVFSFFTLANMSRMLLVP